MDADVGGAATHGGTDLSDINVTINDIADLKNRPRIEEKQGEEEAEVTVESAGVMRDWMRRKMRKMKI